MMYRGQREHDNIHRALQKDPTLIRPFDVQVLSEREA